MIPAQRPHTSEQTVCTPLDFLRAVEDRFGHLDIDLACNEENAVLDSIAADGADWHGHIFRNAWRNPPFNAIADFAKRSAEYRGAGRIFMLVPASVGSNWFREYVHRRAYVLALSPRLTFVGHSSPYPKDLILCVYGAEGLTGFDCWRWKGK